MKCFIYFTILLYVTANAHKLVPEDFRQEGAKVLFANPKFVQNATVFTYRRNRNSPYLTTLNLTTLQPIGDNVSTLIEFKNIKVLTNGVKLELRACDFFMMKWSREWLSKYSDVPVKRCPLPEGTYHVKEMEIPPKDFPIKINPGDYYASILYSRISTGEKLLEVAIYLIFKG